MLILYLKRYKRRFWRRLIKLQAFIMTRKYESTYRKSRSKKPISLYDAELRLSDCIKQMEKVVLDGDYDPKEVQLKQQAVYAMSNAINRLLKVKETRDLETRIQKLEENLS